MFERFHDEEYDGLVVKLPNWFIKLNGLENLIDEFKTKLVEKSTLSIMHMDFSNSVKELEEYKFKSDKVKENKLKEEESRKSILKWKQDRVDRNIIDVDWVEYRIYPLHGESIYLNKDERYEMEDFINKGGKSFNKKLLSEFNKKVQLLNDEDFKTFLLINGLTLSGYELGKHIRVPDNCLYIDNQLNLCCRFLIIGVKVYVDNLTYYDKIMFYYLQEDNDFIVNIARKNFKPILLSDYNIEGNLLIKKDYIKNS